MRLVVSLVLLCGVAFVVGASPQRRPPANVDTLLSEAGALVNAGRLEEAEAATRKILATHPRNAQLPRRAPAHLQGGTEMDNRVARNDTRHSIN